MSVPFRSSIMDIRDDWIDFNGHLNMAYYNVLFDHCIDEIHEVLGLGPKYRRKNDASTFTAEAHVVYVRELCSGDKVHVTCQILDADEKRIHSFLELSHTRQGYLSAVSEQLHLHVDMKTRRVVPFPREITDLVTAMAQTHRGLPRSRHIGRVIGMGNRTGAGVSN